MAGGIFLCVMLCCLLYIHIAYFFDDYRSSIARVIFHSLVLLYQVIIPDIISALDELQNRC